MKRFYSLITAASLSVVMVANGLALAFDDQSTPPILLASPRTPLTLCLVIENEGYPNPGGSGCSYLRAGSPLDYSTAWNPEALMSGRSVAIGQMGKLCSTPMMVCELRHESFVGKGCYCNTADGRVWGTVTR
jgi:hypothetical protein